MGQSLIRLIQADSGLTLVGGLEQAGSSAVGADLGTLAGMAPLGITASDNYLDLLAKADAVIDFTAPEASVELAAAAAQARIVHIIGTTGFDAAQEDAIAAAGRHATIVKSGNMSLGVNLLAVLVAQAARALGDDWDIEILDLRYAYALPYWSFDYRHGQNNKFKIGDRPLALALTVCSRAFQPST